MKVNKLIVILVEILVFIIIFFSFFGEDIDSLIFGDLLGVKQVDAYEVREIEIEKIETQKPLTVTDQYGNVLFKLNGDGTCTEGLWADDNEFSNESIESDFVSLDTVMYTTDRVNVREEASIDSASLLKLNIGKEVYVVGYFTKDWYLVHIDDKEGYIKSEYLNEENPLTKVSSTAYWNEYNRRAASGRNLIEGRSIAGKIEWLGKYADIYSCNDDGSVGSFLGTYRFDDTGYGAETGYGKSVILGGQSIGTIENGTCIDFYKEYEGDCWAYGRRDVYILVKD